MNPKVTLVGRPFRPIGTGEVLRSTFRSLRAVGTDVCIRDIGDPSENAEFETGGDMRARLVDRLDTEVTVVMMNGDERQLVFDRLASELARAGRKVVFPAWELPRYPEVWARELEHYDEIWAFSSYCAASFREAVRRPVHVLPLPCHPKLTRPISRRHLGISESAYVFVFFFDLTSYVDRKNPFALVECISRIREARPYADFQFVLKVGTPGRNPDALERLKDSLAPHRRHTLLIERVLTDNEIKNLVRVGDAFVSLHRAEGFGFGPGEAMYFGKPVIATGYSGNMEYMNADTAKLVDYELIPVKEGQYPHWAGQVWADPDIEEAAAHMIALLDDPVAGRVLGARASAHVRTHFSQRACGLRFQRRLDEIASDTAHAPPKKPALEASIASPRGSERAL